MQTIPKMLIIGAVWPEPASSAGGSRTLQLMELFGAKGWKMTFASAAADSEFAADIATYGIDKVRVGLNSSSFDEFISKLQPDIVMFDRFMTEEQFGWRVAENCPAALRILDTIDLHCLRQARHAAVKQNRSFGFDDLFSDVAKREIASILRCDISLIISDFEMGLLTEHFKLDEELLHYIPFLLPGVTGKLKPFDERKGFVTIGNFLHEPNWDSVKYLKENIWPLIRKEMPDAEMNVYGAYTSQKVEQLHKPSEGFYIRGRAKDSNEVIRNAKVLLAPLRFGAGIKGKLTEAMQCGTPSVTTSVGAEGMHGESEWNGIIADQAGELAAAALELYQNREKWEKAQRNGVKIITDFYDKRLHGEKLIRRISEISSRLKYHRMKNFYGAMLMHHTLAGTKYMSKWIEEKNKK
ncbi:MAG: glycosyltransferase [Bacteroidia bacterium]